MTKEAGNTEAWLVLVASLPASNPALRMRVWRALRSLGCGVLRDGVYLLPNRGSLRQTLRMQTEEIRQGGGSANLLDAANSSADEKTDFQRLFDRGEDYRELMARIGKFEAEFAALDQSAGRRQLKLLRRDLEGLVALDYFPSAGKAEADAMLAQVESMFLANLAPGEPQAAPGAVVRREAAAYRGRLWATREHLWVDRMASAWLIRRFIDPAARFLWLERPEDCPAEAVGFDFDGAAFTHVGKRVTFEVLLASFGLDSDPALTRLAALVHSLDIGGSAVAEAAGVEIVLAGARQRCADDDALLDEAARTLESLYAAYSEAPKEG
ncbi:MAG: chromate resistance protein [Sulfuricella sp.]|nr:chromate resistance protein [Sulfuricella sp.]